MAKPVTHMDKYICAYPDMAATAIYIYMDTCMQADSDVAAPALHMKTFIRSYSDVAYVLIQMLHCNVHMHTHTHIYVYMYECTQTALQYIYKYIRAHSSAAL